MENTGLRMREPRLLDALVGRSRAMVALAETVEPVLDSTVTVCLLGETGTGKEVVARAIHDLGPRRGKPFVAINCAAIPESLQDAELFGHERGAFTGAVGQRQGCFEQANGGTLFLDELGEMSASTQARLLRTLQERTIRRIGGAGDIRIDVRILCATRRDLIAEMSAGRFREDLYFRLVVFPVELPPLRGRHGDVLLLFQHALRQLAREQGRSDVEISDEAIELLDDYTWPGNVRELMNVAQRSLLVCRDGVIGIEHLPAHIRARSASDPPISSYPPASRPSYPPASRPSHPPASRSSYVLSASPPPSTFTDEFTPLPPSQTMISRPPVSGQMYDLERQAIERALETTGGNVPKAAALLGLSRATLYRRMAAFLINRR